MLKTEEKTRQTKSVKKGDIVLAKTYLQVENVESAEKIVVKNIDTGDRFFIKGSELIDGLDSADNYQSSKSKTMTQLAEILTSSHIVPFTVCFNKKSGEERILRGKFLSVDKLMGRSNVEDLDLPSDQHRLRQVDHREINWIIVGNVKYTKKKR